MATRLPVVVRDATPDDAEALVSLWRINAGAARDKGSEVLSPNVMWREPDIEEAATAIKMRVDDPTRRLLVAAVDDEVIGMLSGFLGTLTPIHLTRVMIVTELEVRPEWRRKLVASTLLSAAVHWAEEKNCDIVLTVSAAHSREPNRFLAKLGFGQVSTIRAAQVSMLRSRFASKATNSRDTGKLIAVRRTLRRRQIDSGI
ncbi:hypothetical protein BH09ACT10_BH09ACT10_02350 [soil metagenome]